MNFSMCLVLCCVKIDCCIMILCLVFLNIVLFIDEYLFLVFLCMIMKLMLLVWWLVSGDGMLLNRCVGCRLMYWLNLWWNFSSEFYSEM